MRRRVLRALGYVLAWLVVAVPAWGVVFTHSSSEMVLASHDADFVPQLRRLLGAGRQVGVLALREFVSVELAGLQDQGMAFYDLEDEVGAFTAALPRIRIIPLDEFDPRRYL